MDKIRIDEWVTLIRWLKIEKMTTKQEEKN